VAWETNSLQSLKPGWHMQLKRSKEWRDDLINANLAQRGGDAEEKAREFVLAWGQIDRRVLSCAPGLLR
jgi:alpha-glucuronidase